MPCVLVCVVLEMIPSFPPHPLDFSGSVTATGNQGNSIGASIKDSLPATGAEFSQGPCHHST